MITGTVNAKHEALVCLQVVGAGSTQDVEAILDTGFNGSLTLPIPFIALLGLPWRSSGDVVLANGQVEAVDVHAATVMWDGVPRNVLVHAMDGAPLLGTTLLLGHDLRIRMVPGGRVEIEPVP
jgi:clan AA aspartic protease